MYVFTENIIRMQSLKNINEWKAKTKSSKPPWISYFCKNTKKLRKLISKINIYIVKNAAL